MAPKDKPPKAGDKLVSLADQLRAHLGDKLDQLPDAVLGQISRVKAGDVLKNPHLPDLPGDANYDVEFRNMDELLGMYPPGTEGQKSSEARISPAELQERPLIYKLDLHPEARRPDEKLDEIVEKKIRNFIVPRVRSRDEAFKYVLIVTGQGVRGEMKGFVETVLSKLKNEGVILQFFPDRHSAAFRVEIK